MVIRGALLLLIVAGVAIALAASPCSGSGPRTSGEQVAEPAAATADAVTEAAADGDGLFHPRSPVGVTTGIGMIPPRLFEDYDLSRWPAEARRDVQMMADVGGHWYRHHTSHFPAFDQRSLEADGFDWTYRDELVTAVQEAEIDILLMIGRTHGLASCRQWRQYLAKPYVPRPGEEEQRYRDYVQAVVERYDGDGTDDMPGLRAPIRWFQLGNENDLHHEACQGAGVEYATPAEYLALLQMTKGAMAAASPDARLAASMTFGRDIEKRTSWTEQLLSLDDGAALQVLDAVDIHDYSRDLGNQRRRIDLLHRFTGGEVPIWITETSVPGDPAAREGWDWTRQARALPPIYCQALSTGKVDRVLWHTLSDGPPVHQSRAWRNFGTNSLYGCSDPVELPGRPAECGGFELKPVGRAFRLTSGALDGWKAVRELKGGAGYRVEREGRGDALVLIDEGTTFDAAAALGVSAVAVWDMVDPDALGGRQPDVSAGPVAVGANPLLVTAAE